MGARRPAQGRVSDGETGTGQWAAHGNGGMSKHDGWVVPLCGTNAAAHFLVASS